MTWFERIIHALLFCDGEMAVVDTTTFDDGYRIERYQCPTCGKRKVVSLRWEEQRGEILP